MSANASGQPDNAPERFPSSSRLMGFVVLAGLAVVVVVVLLDGFDLTRVAVVAGAVLLGLGVWLTMVRPAVNLHKDYVLVRNALTDVMVPWHLVESVEVRQVLVIRTGERTVHGMAVGRSARQQLRRGRVGKDPATAAEGWASTQGTPLLGGDEELRIPYADAVAGRIDNLASARRSEAHQLTAIDKRWRRAEVLAIVGVAIAFGLLFALAIVV